MSGVGVYFNKFITCSRMLVIVCDRVFLILVIVYNLFLSCQWWLVSCFCVNDDL
jgi:hypothetical protein